MVSKTVIPYMYLLCQPEIWAPKAAHIDVVGPHTGYFHYFSDERSIMGNGVWYGYRSSTKGATSAANIVYMLPMMDINYILDGYILGAGRDMYEL